MSAESSSEERDSNMNMDPLVKECFIEVYKQLDQLKKDLIYERTGREIMENQIEEIVDINNKHIIELEILRRRLLRVTGTRS